jgi:hypothetical protein
VRKLTVNIWGKRLKYDRQKGMQRNDFPENLMKGRIAETVFELMFREKTAFDVYPLGYEHTIPIPSPVSRPQNPKK